VSITPRIQRAYGVQSVKMQCAAGRVPKRVEITVNLTGQGGVAENKSYQCNVNFDFSPDLKYDHTLLTQASIKDLLG